MDRSLVFAFDDLGGFIAGNTATRLTSYAFASSQWAAEARDAPRNTAKKMMGNEGARDAASHDYINWRRFGEAQKRKKSPHPQPEG